MQRNFFVSHPFVYPTEVEPRYKEVLDEEHMRGALSFAHILLETRIADAVLYAEAQPTPDLRRLMLDEVDGLCLALRTISGHKYGMTNFIDPGWVAKHKSGAK